MLGVANQALGLHTEAEAVLRSSLALRLELLGPDHREVIESRESLAITLHTLQRHDEAREQFETALQTAPVVFEAEPARIATLHAGLAAVLKAAGHCKDAQTHWQTAVWMFAEVDAEMPEPMRRRFEGGVAQRCSAGVR